MLGVFRTKWQLRPLQKSALEDDFLEKYFGSYFDEWGTANFGINGFLSYTCEQIYPGPLSQLFPSFPRRIVSSPGMHTSGNYCCVIRSDASVGIDTFIAAYNRAKRRSDGSDRQFFELWGRRNYCGILYDKAISVDPENPENTYTHVYVVNGFDGVTMHWGTDSEGSLVVSDVGEFVDEVCGSRALFYFSGMGMLIRVPVSAAPASSSSGDSG